MEIDLRTVQALRLMSAVTPWPADDKTRALAKLGWATRVPLAGAKPGKFSGSGYVLTVEGQVQRAMARTLILEPVRARWWHLATRRRQRACSHVRGWMPRPDVMFQPGHCVKCGRPHSK